MKVIKNIAKSFSYLKHNHQRKPFSLLEEKDVHYFKGVMQEKYVVTDEHEIEPHNLCFRKNNKGSSKLLLCPQNT